MFYLDPDRFTEIYIYVKHTWLYNRDIQGQAAWHTKLPVISKVYLWKTSKNLWKWAIFYLSFLIITKRMFYIWNYHWVSNIHVWEWWLSIKSIYTNEIMFSSTSLSCFNILLPLMTVFRIFITHYLYSSRVNIHDKYFLLMFSCLM